MSIADLTIQSKMAALAEILIKACGGYTAAALECDISKSQLQRAADQNHSYSLKASTIFHLEQACGRPLMSAALYELGRREQSVNSICPVWIGIDLSKSATDLTVLVRGAWKDGVVSIHEFQTLSAQASVLLENLSALQSAIAPSVFTSRPDLKAFG